jgi:hypothetical protein
MNRNACFSPAPATAGRWTDAACLGFEAGDANLYRYAGNNPANAVDPSGLQAVQFPVPKLDAYTQYDVPTGKLDWEFIKPTPPEGLNVYSEVDLRWTIEKTPPKEARKGYYDFSAKKEDREPREGSYHFWLEGLPRPAKQAAKLNWTDGSRLMMQHKPVLPKVLRRPSRAGSA